MNFNTQKCYLCLAGLVLSLVGAYIGLAPEHYFASYNPGTSPRISFVSELRGLGGSLLLFGLFALTALRVEGLAASAITATTLVFSAFVGFRMLSTVLDGVPGQGVWLALAIELLLALFGWRVLWLAGRHAARLHHAHTNLGVSP